MKAVKIGLQLALIAVVVAGVALGARWLFAHVPKLPRKPAGVGAVLVEVTTLTPGRQEITVTGMGTVEPAQAVTLTPQVTGRIAAQHPQLVEGGLLRAGAVVARIEAREYELALESEKGKYERAVFELELEKGRGVVAEQEWSLLGEEVGKGEAGKALALRQPHLRSAQAAVAAARSGVELAEIQIERTTIRAPFNGLVREENAEVGQLVGPQTALAVLVGTDCFWVRVSVPVEQLEYVAIPGPEGGGGAACKVTCATGRGGSIVRAGRVVRLLGDLDPKGRMARLMVAVDDPLGLRGGGLPLLVSAYVRVEIEGRAFEDVCALPRKALREDGAVWIMNEADELEVRPVTVVWRTPESALIRGADVAGARVVVSRIATPVPGMKLRLGGDDARGQGGAAAKGDGRP